MTTFAAVITRTQLSLADLTLSSAPYRILRRDYDPGATSLRRQVATSPYIAGGVVVDAVADIGQGSLTVLTTSTSQANLRSALSTLVAAFTQASWELQVSYDGSVYRWACNAADYAPDWSFTPFDRWQWPVRFTFPRQPIAVSGPI